MKVSADPVRCLAESPRYAGWQGVTGRFHIEELLRQDSEGVVFGVIDRETERPVSLRRFFPFGAEGGGFAEEEAEAYGVAVSRLVKVHHPGLRTIIAGGCDPVDGVPWLVTERVEGGALDSLVAGQPLPVEDAIGVLARALEVSAVLSRVLGEEAVWVETDARSIVRDGVEEGRGFTFGICPLKWLGGGKTPRGFEGIAALAEEIMHWRGQLVGDQAGRGLGGWVKWLRAAPPSATLREAMEMLAAATGSEPPPAMTTLLREATAPPVAAGKPVKVPKPDSAKPQLIAIVFLVLAIAGILGYQAMRRNGALPANAPDTASLPVTGLETESQAPSAPEPLAPPAEAPPVAESPRAPVRAIPVETDEPPAPDPVERINRRAEEMSAQLAESQAAEAARQDEIRKGGNVYQISDSGLLGKRVREEVVLESVVAGIGRSNSGKTIYLLFSEKAPVTEARGAVYTNLLGGDLTEESLEKLVGNKVRVRGIVALEPAGRNQRPVVRFRDRAAIEVVE